LDENALGEPWPNADERDPGGVRERRAGGARRLGRGWLGRLAVDIVAFVAFVHAPFISAH
jgi:hypothetical protein